ncbi:hypothetical protein [Sphingobium baderi]|uniref:Uncharacterized protein n=1 Tax=Sphingobium baderi TaxID=1332080 RepID=A0A0S3EV24_9SPHN|nr:hypothetical protein [Sphingobium baderi]ALR19268.1 hypothetical protein ATN00_02060 [Sphingobium baderi]
MAAILLTPANLHHLKSCLRVALPYVKSSYISEGLAAALGYRTHAALLADMKASPEKYPPLGRASDVKLAERLSDFKVTDCVASVEGVARDAVPDPIWCVAKRADREANSRWHQQCRRRGFPLIFVYVTGKSAQLDWDYITLDPKREAHLHDEAGLALEDRMIASFQKRAANDLGNPSFRGTSCVGRIVRLAPATARALADDFFEMLYTPVRAA